MKAPPELSRAAPLTRSPFVAVISDKARFVGRARFLHIVEHETHKLRAIEGFLNRDRLVGKTEVRNNFYRERSLQEAS